MPTIEVEDAPKGTEATEQIEGIEIGEGGRIFVSLPHLVSDMTQPDQAQVLEWYVKEGDIVVGQDEQEEMMLLLEFLGDGCLLAIPPLGPVRVVKIEASVGKVIHLHDPLIVFEPVQG